MNPDEDPKETPEEEPAPDERAGAVEPAPEPVFDPEPAPSIENADVPLASAEPPPRPDIDAIEAQSPFGEPPSPFPAAAEQEPEPEPEPEPLYTPPPSQARVKPQDLQPAYDPPPAPEPEPVYDFGEPEIPMPHVERRSDRQRARDARINLDLDLGRIKRRKRYGLFITTISVLFIAFVLAPVTWAAAYLFFDPPSTMLMMQRAAEGETIRHYPVPINRMSPHIVRAVIAAEDSWFCTHDGFDVEAIQNALESNARGRRMRGGSTVSQQTAKNLFLWPERSWLRKGFETYFTALIEFMWPKRRIMEAYLNSADWGDGNFGIEAAARSRFGVSAADLTPLQAARLAAVLPSPNRWRADSPGPYVRRRAATIVERARVVRNERTAACVLMLDRPNTGR
jgi:monofunctional biosynthetic peptidoglycan transglycosylase